MTKHITPHWKSLLDEFELDWRLAGLAPKTAKEYVRHLHGFLTLFPEPTAMNAKQWLEQCPKAPSRRYKARALRRFAKWLDARGDHCMNWWNDVPLAVERPRPQATVTHDDYLSARSRVTQPRDAVIVELLWCIEVLNDAIGTGVANLSWQTETFAYADGHDGEKWVGLVSGQYVTVRAGGLVVRPAEATAQLNSIPAPTPTPSGGEPVPIPGGNGPQPGTGARRLSQCLRKLVITDNSIWILCER